MTEQEANRLRKIFEESEIFQYFEEKGSRMAERAADQHYEMKGGEGSRMGKIAHELHGKEMLKGIHRPDVQSRNGIKGGRQTWDSGKGVENLEAAWLKCKELYESGDPDFLAHLKAKGTKAITLLNTDIATCTKCGFTGGKNAMRQWHSIPDGPDKCGKPRKYTEKQKAAQIVCGQKGLPSLLAATEERKVEFKNREQLLFDNLPDVFRKEDVLSVSNEIGIKLNYNYLNNTNNYEKIGFGVWRKTGTNAILKTKKLEEVDTLYNAITTKDWFSVGDTDILNLDIKKKRRGSILRDYPKLFEKKYIGNKNVYKKL
jgi:hypothetical protein